MCIMHASIVNAGHEGALRPKPEARSRLPVMSAQTDEIDWTDLADAARVRAAGLFVAEGRAIVARVLERAGPGGFEVIRVLAAPAAVAALGLDALVGDRLDIRAPAEMQRTTGFNFHRGVLALVRRPPARPLADILGPPCPRVPLVVCEHLVDVDNVGSVFRNAHAFGARGVLLDDTSADPLYRKSVRTSMGAVLATPWAVVPGQMLWPSLRQAGYRLLALTPAAEAPDLREALAQVPGCPVAIVVGNEGHGLSAAALDACDARSRIPMAAGANSLNVATAVAVALYAFGERG